MAAKELDLQSREIQQGIYQTQDEIIHQHHDRAAFEIGGVNHRIRRMRNDRGQAGVVQSLRAMGASEAEAIAIEQVAYESVPSLPLPIIAVMRSYTRSKPIDDYHAEVYAATSALETSRWITRGKKGGSNDLFKKAYESGSPFECFMYAAQAVNVSIRGEYAGKLMAYLISQDFYQDMESHLNGEADPVVKDLFDLLDPVLKGMANDDMKARFESALHARISKALDIQPEQVARLAKPGLDARIQMLDGADGKPRIGAVYITTDESERKMEDTGGSFDRHFDGLLQVAESQDATIVLHLVSSPMVPHPERMADHGESGADKETLSGLLRETAILQVAVALFSTSDYRMLDAIVAGKVEIVIVPFSHGEHYELGTDFLKEIKDAFYKVREAFAPNLPNPGTDRGKEVLRSMMQVITQSERHFPESMSWRDDETLIDYASSVAAAMPEQMQKGNHAMDVLDIPSKRMAARRDAAHKAWDQQIIERRVGQAYLAERDKLAEEINILRGYRAGSKTANIVNNLEIEDLHRLMSGEVKDPRTLTDVAKKRNGRRSDNP